MLYMIVRRFLWSLIVFTLVSVVVFTLVELLPGDAATAYLGRNATPERLALVRSELGLDRPAPERFVAWVGGILHGDLGTSLSQRQPVGDLVWGRLRNSLLIGLIAAVISIPLSLLLGVIAGLNRDRWPDSILSIISLISMSLPEFVIGTLLIFVFSLQFGLLPAVTIIDDTAPLNELLPYTILPVITLTLIICGYLLRIMRTSIIDALRSEHVQMAELKGLPALRVVLWHALPGALLPAVTASALVLAYMIGNLVVIEAVFNYPGLGTLALNAIQDRDLPLVQAIVLVLAGCYLLINLLADIITFMLNPRLRTLRAG
ncbi:MAG: ABC transporter permease [Chloroflexaceae bacterium]|nr:ABC transporter permease [Chloroflexaceae bacterium]